MIPNTHCPIKYKIYAKLLNRSIWLIDWTLIVSTTLDQSEPESNGNKDVFHTTQISRTRVSPSDAVYCHTQEDTLSFVGGKILPFCRACYQCIVNPTNSGVKNQSDIIIYPIYSHFSVIIWKQNLIQIFDDFFFFQSQIQTSRHLF